MCALCCLIVSYDYSFASLFDIVFLHFSLLLLLLLLFSASFVRFSYSFDSFIHYVYFPLFYFDIFHLFFHLQFCYCRRLLLRFFFLCCFRLFVTRSFALLPFPHNNNNNNFFFSHFYLLSSKYAVCIVFFSFRCCFVLFCCAFASLHCHSMKLKIANIKRLCTTKQQQPELGFIRHQISFSVRLSYRFLFTTENGKIREKQKNEPTHSHKPKIVSLKI